jgi:hypothetical protein
VTQPTILEHNQGALVARMVRAMPLCTDYEADARKSLALLAKAAGASGG